MKIILRIIIASAFIISGALAFHIGSVYGLPYAVKDRRAQSIIEAEAFVRGVKRYYMDSALYKQNDPLKIADSGAKLLFAVPGGLLILLGGVLLMTPLLSSMGVSVRKRRAIRAAEKKAAQAKKKTDVPASNTSKASGAGTAFATGTAAGTVEIGGFDISSLEKMISSEDEIDQTGEPKRKRFLVPDELMDETTDKEMFHDIEKVVALSQSIMSERYLLLSVTVLRPGFIPYIGLLNDRARDRLGRQIIQYHVLRLKREEEGISADQFAVQDKRMTEIERETICRRYMPKSTDDLPEETFKLIGKVYTLTEQSRVQQSTLSDAEDWQDMSLRNFVSVMSEPVSG